MSCEDVLSDLAALYPTYEGVPFRTALEQATDS